MANAAEYVASIGLDLDNLEKGIAQARQKLGELGKGAPTTGIDSFLSQISGKLKKFGEDMTKLGTTLTVSVTAPLVVLAKQIADVGFAYEKAMNTFQAVTKATADEMAKASKVAEQLGADMTLPATSAGDAALAMTELAKGGFTAAQAMDAAKGALQLAAAAGIDEARAAEITANAINTFGLAASDAAKVSDLLAAASNASSAEITDIAHAMQQAGASAAALHIPIQDLVTGIAEMANAGIKGSDAGTSLKTMMNALTPDTKKAAAAMQQLGIDAFDAQGKFVGFETVIRQAAPALARMTDEQKANAIQTAFGSDAQRAANIILGQGVEAWQKMSGAVGQSGAAAELAAAKTKGLSGAWDGFISQLETAGLKVFQALAPTIENVVRKVADFTAGLATVSPEIIRMGAAAAAVAGTAGPLALLIGQLAKLTTGGVITVGVIAGVAAIAAAYESNFGAMTKVVDDFFRMFSTNAKSFEGAGTVITKTLILVVAGADRFIVALENIAVNVVTVGKLMIASATGDWASLATIWAEGRGKLDRIENEYLDRVRVRQLQLEAIQRGGMKELFTVLQNMSASGGQFAAQAFGDGWEKTNPVQGIRARTVSEFSKMTDEMRKYGLLGGQAFGQGLKQGHDSEVYKSPHFIIHQTMTALGELNAQVEEPSTKAGRKMAAAIKKAFKEEMGSINEWLGDLGGGLKLDESIAKLLTDKIVVGMRELAKAADESKDKLQAWGITLETAFQKGAKGLQVFIEDGAIKIRETSIKILSNVTDVAKKIGEIKVINPFEILADEKFVEATKRTGNDIIRIQTETDDKIKAETKQTQETLKESWKEGQDKIKETIKRSQEEIISIFGEGLGGVIIKVGNLLKLNQQDVAKWAGNVGEVLRTMPGKFGEMARGVASTVNQWAEFANSILKILHDLNNKIPSTIGGIIESIGGIFKGGTDKIKAGLEEWDAQTGQVFQDIGKNASESGKQAGDGFSKSFLSALGTITAGLGTFFATRGQGRAAGILGGAAAGAQIGSLFGPWGTAIGAGVGAIAGLFGSGKSSQQKAAEEAAKKQAALDMERFVVDLNNAILDGLNKGFELLEKLQTFSEVPRKAIKRFLNEIFRILSMFVEESAQFKAEGLAAAKAVTDNLGSTFSFLLSGADLIEKIKGIEEVTQGDVDKLFASIDKILDAWFSLTEYIEKGVAKRASKIGGLLQTSLETIQLIPATIKAMTEVPDITDEMIEKPFVWGKKILDRFFLLADEFKALALNRTVKTAEAFQKIFESGKSMFEFFKLWSDYKPLEDSVFDAINSDFDRVTAWFQSAIDKTVEWLSQGDVLKDNLLTLAENMSAIGSAISGAFSGQNLSLQGGGSLPLTLAGGGGSSSSSTTNIGQVIIPPPTGADMQTYETFREYLNRYFDEIRADARASGLVSSY